MGIVRRLYLYGVSAISLLVLALGIENLVAVALGQVADVLGTTVIAGESSGREQLSHRKVHAHPTPTLGGLAIFLGIICAGGVASFMPEFDAVFVQSAQPLGIAAAALVIFALGVFDDFRPLTAAPKLAGQVLRRLRHHRSRSRSA